MKIKDSPLCTYCKENEESISHLFYECREVFCIVTSLENWMKESHNVDVVLNKSDIILGKSGEQNSCLNLIFLVFKRYIYECKMKEQPLNFFQLKAKIFENIRFEKYICKKNDKIQQFNKKWEKFDFVHNLL